VTARRLAVSVLGAAVVAVALIVAVGGGGHPYRVRLMLDNAGGLRSGSDVTIGGVKAGTVSLHLGRGDKVVADLELDSSQRPVGRNALAAISAVNFLGQKRVELAKGDLANPAPSGYVIPAAHVMTSTDLDQVLGVLDADTRTRLKILINEAGAAFTGRRADFSRLLQELPQSMIKATTLLNQLVSDNHTLGRLLASSDRFVSEVAGRRKSLTRMVDVLGQTAATVSARRAQLRQTLAQAPGTLATLQRFLGDLRATTIPLGPAARDITSTAPALSATLAQVDPFRKAADPALVQATGVAPELTHLAVGATPVLRRAAPTAASLASFSTALTPVSDTLNHSVDNILAVIQNWSRAIQFRDGLSHVFRGEAVVTAETLRSIVDRLVPKVRKRQSRHGKVTAPAGRRPTPAVPQLPAVKPKLPTVRVPPVGETLDKIVNGVLHAPGSRSGGSDAAAKLLDYLLGR
jgi:phospholipid/cholesterol/gamma-HCH transport system substrate-binding protein